MPSETPASTETCSTLQTDNPSVNIIRGDSTLSVSKDPVPDDVAETSVRPQVERRVSCTKCSRLAKRVRKVQKNNSFLRKRSRDLKKPVENRE